MATWQIVDTSNNSVVATFPADRIRYETVRGGLAFVIGLNGENGKGTVVTIVPLTGNRYIRQQGQ